MPSETRPTGLTRDSGWQIGVRRTLPLAHEAMWQLLVGPAGLRCWLGDAPDLTLAPGASYRLADGTAGALTLVSPYSHLRLTWQPPSWARASIIQLRVIPGAGRTVVALHHEQLPDAAARAARRAFFTHALDQIAALVNAGRDGGDDSPAEAQG